MCRIPFRFSPGMLAVTLLLACGSVLTWPRGPLDAAEPEKKETKLKQLLKERLGVLRTLAELVSESYKSGRGTADKVYEAELMVLHAELDLCDTDKDRLAGLEQIVKKAKEYEDELAMLSKAGQVSQRSMLKATLDRIAAAIALEKFRAPMALGGK